MKFAIRERGGGQNGAARVAAVEVTPDDDARRIVDYLEPYMGVTGAERALCSVQIVRSPERLRALSRLADSSLDRRPMVLHGAQEGVAFVDETGLSSVVHGGGHVVYQRARVGPLARVCFICGEFSDEVVLDLLRIVRGLCIGAAEAAAFRCLHMAALARQGSAIAFIGPSGAGKTSCVLSVLQEHADAAFVTNDKALVRVEAGSACVTGLPYAVSIGRRAFELCEPLARLPAVRWFEGEALIFPRDIAWALGRSLCPVARLDGFIWVSLDPEAASAQVRAVDDRRERRAVLSEHVHRFTHQIHPSWLLEWIGLSAGASGEPSDELCELPFLEFRGNPWHSSQLTSVCEALWINAGSPVATEPTRPKRSEE